MLTIISLILVLAGCVNWFCIGLLQYDFVAGLFGSQSSIFSRIVYFLVGVGAAYLTYTLIKNKGKLKFNFKKFKKETQEKLESMTQENQETKSQPSKKIVVEKKQNQNPTKKKTIKLMPDNYNKSLAQAMAEHSKEVFKQNKDDSKID